MKLSWKIVLTVLLIVTLTVSVSSYIMIASTFQAELDSQAGAASGESQMLCLTLGALASQAVGSGESALLEQLEGSSFFQNYAMLVYRSDGTVLWKNREEPANLTPADVAESCEALVKAIDASQIVMLPGGFSGGDEPDGSAKFIASFFRNPEVTEAVRRLLQQRDGLMLGICNGFQALIKLGLVPYGDIRPITACDPTLTFNTIGRHQSMLVHTRVASTGSPWLSKCEVGEMHTVAISHGEGRFVAPQEVLDTMLRNGQVATQYVDLTGVPTMDQRFNPNGSVLAIEGITSPDGRVFGKMGHSERSGEYLYKNVTGDKYQPIFEGGVDYFKV